MRMNPTRRAARGVVWLAALLVAAGPVVALQAPAHAQSRVTVTNASGAAVADPGRATTMTLRGSGFQSVKGGRGGIYVAFGTVKGTWQPSRGGITGRDYFYVPDNESGKNDGFQKYVAFPGSSTSGEANGGVIAANGSWSTTLSVPGARFNAADRDGKVTTIDCTKVQCGVITLGAHGIKNGRNETFTPIRFAATTATPSTPTATSSVTPDAGATTAPTTPTAPTTGPTGKPRLKVDQASARAGAALSFTAAGMTPGRQVTVVLDDGASAAGPFLVGTDGTFAGVLQVPASIGAGTHELRVYGTKPAASLNFAIAAASPGAQPVAVDPEPAAGTLDTTEGRLAVGFTVVAGVLVLMALARLLVARRGRRA